MRARLFLALCLFACDRSKPATDAGPRDEDPPPATPVSGGAVVRGRVRLEGPVPAQRLRPVTVAKEACGTEPKPDRSLVVGTHGEVAWAVVTLTGTTAGAPAPRRTIVDHARCDFYPYITVVPPGSTIRIENSDDALHGIRQWGSSEAISLRPGGEAMLVLPKAARTRLVCDLHYWSSAWIVTTTAPHHDVTDAHGAFALEGVPAGSWRLFSLALNVAL